eukprot:Ihof_evm2s252 gene=Ihof_evmTU2s252
MTMSDFTPDFTDNFFAGLIETSDTQRNKEVEHLVSTIKFWAATQHFTPSHKELLHIYLPGVLRLSIQCPFKDIRTKFASLLADLQDGNMLVPHRRFAGPSRYVMSGFLSVSSNIPEEHELFKDMFMHDGRVSHMMEMMTAFPELFNAIMAANNMTMRCDGPLPLDWRAYIAMMASSRFNCSYLVHLKKTQFLAYGGDPKWVEGISFAPTRIQNLQELNCLMAHRPWAITPDHIKGLVRGADSWSLSELAQIVVILTTFHSFSCFVFGVGVTPEIDAEDGHVWSSNGQPGEKGSAEHSSSPLDPEGWTQKTIEALKIMQGVDDDLGNGETNEADRQFQIFEKLESETDAITPIASLPTWDVTTDVISLYTNPPKTSPPVTAPFHCSSPCHDVHTKAYAHIRMKDRESEREREKNHELKRREQASAASCGWPLEHTDFDTKNDRICRVQDYSWQTHAYSQLSRLYGVADLLDAEFQVAFEMTDNTLGGAKVDTSKFRKAIWFYIHRVFGILQDDYDYSE